MKLCVGGAQFNGGYGILNSSKDFMATETRKILRLAKQNGINHVDTAHLYGLSETRIGNSDIEGLKLISKPGAMDLHKPNFDVEFFGCLNQSLDRLKVGQIYGYLLHRPEQLFEERGNELFNLLKSAKEMKLVSKIGVSVYEPDMLSRILRNFEIDIVQLPINLVDNRFYESGLLAQLKKRGVEIHARSAFLQGLLVTPMADHPPFFDKWRNTFLNWERWLQHPQKKDAVSVCWRYLESLEMIDFAVVGANSVSHLKQILDCTHSDVSLEGMPNLFSKDLNLIDPRLWR